MRIVGLLFLLWAGFGCAVVVMMVYGVFDHVALNEPVMAAILATGTAVLGGLGALVSARRYWPGGEARR